MIDYNKNELMARQYRFDKAQESYSILKNRIIQDEVQKQCIEYLSDYRKINLNLLIEEGLFYSENEDELYYLSGYDDDIMYSLGFKNSKIRFDNRYMFPILNGKRNLCAWVGYDFESESKYLVGMLGFGDKKRLLYGIHDIENAYKEDTILLVEGMFDRVRLKSIGIKTANSLLGKNMSPWHKKYINRFKNKILIPDGDSRGQEAIAQWKEGLNGNIAIIKLQTHERELNYPDGKITKIAKDIDDLLREDISEQERFINLYKELKTRLNNGEHYIEETF